MIDEIMNANGMSSVADKSTAHRDENTRSPSHVDGNENVTEMDVTTSGPPHEMRIEATSNAPIERISSIGDDYLEEVELNLSTIGNVGSPKNAANVTRKSKSRKKFRVRCCAAHCKELFDSCDAMLFHMMIYHANGVDNTFSCHECKRPFASKHELQRHVHSITH